MEASSGFTVNASSAQAKAQPLKDPDQLIDSVETFIFDCDGNVWFVIYLLRNFGALLVQLLYGKGNS